MCILKNKKYILIIITLLLIAITYSFTTKGLPNQSTKDKIIGTWVSESDTKSKWIFSLDNKCKRYYDGNLLKTYNFTITSSSCSNEYDSKYEYVKLSDNANKTYCYAINGITQEGSDTFLSLEYNAKLKPMLFKKQ